MKNYLCLLSRIFIICFSVVSIQSYANEELEGILFENIPVSVASVIPLPINTSPGIVTLITAQEIKLSGARDLIDVFRMVPGFEFVGDVQGCTGITLRGNLADDGKVLLRIDGQEINEILFSGFVLGNRFPVDQIKQIEIIRGPGSAIYGGFAEFAVINIVTWNANEANSSFVSATYGQMKDTYGRRNVNLSYGEKFNDDLSFKFSAFAGEGTRSDRTYNDFFGYSYDMKDRSELNPLFINTKLSYKDFNILYMLDNFNTTEADGYGYSYVDAVKQTFDSQYFETNYSYSFSEQLKITPKFNYKKQAAFNEDKFQSVTMIDSTFSNVYFDAYAERSVGSLQLSYDLLENLNLILGYEYQKDESKDNYHVEELHLDGASYHNQSIYFQSLLNLSFANITLGGREETHSEYGNSFVPRFAVTRSWDDFHAKFLASKSFRVPSISQISLNPDIEPETAKCYEVEIGYLKSNFSLNFNIFDNTLDKAIVYGYAYSDFVIDNYVNEGGFHTQGFELISSIRNDYAYMSLSYSYSKVVDNEMPSYTVPDNDNVFLGIPQHKITLNNSFNISENLTFNPSLIFLSEKYGFDSYNADGSLHQKTFDPNYLLNLYCNYKIPESNFNIGFGVYNVLDEEYDFVVPYVSEHASLPGPSREWILKGTYNY